VWRELQKAAMQEDLDALPSEVAKAPPPPPPLTADDVSPLPDSFEQSILLAQRAYETASDSLSTRLVIEFDTSAGDETYNLLSRTNKFVQPFLPYFAASLSPPTEDEDGKPRPRLQVLWPDEGTSAYVANKWDLPEGTVVGSMSRAKLVDGVEALLLVAPSATEVPAVQRLLDDLDSTAPDTTLLIFNPKLVDMQSTGYGLVGRELRNMVESSFLNCFTLKSFPSGAIFRVYPEGWSAWREDADAEGGYALVYTGVRRPSGDEIDELLADPEEEGEGGNGFNLGKFIQGFQAL